MLDAKKSAWYLVAATLLFSASTHAQTPEKIKTTLLNGPDGIVVDKHGNIYIANWGKDGKGSEVIKIDNHGEETVFVDSLQSPDGLTFDTNGTLYISCFASGEIITIQPNGDRSVFAKNLDHPSDLKFDDTGNLYVSEFGNYNGKKVSKIDKQGKTKTFADGFTVPLGLCFDRNANLYVSNFGTGEIYKVDIAGNKTLFTQLPERNKSYAQYLAIDNAGNLYCASYAGNAIYKISQNGHFINLIPGAILSGPNSLFIYNGMLYFTEFNTQSLYRLRLK
jgi:sugar lactone lactonase YvrE